MEGAGAEAPAGPVDDRFQCAGVLGGPVEGQLLGGAGRAGQLADPGGHRPHARPLQSERGEQSVQRLLEGGRVGGGLGQGARACGGRPVGVGDLQLDRSGNLPGDPQPGSEIRGRAEQGAADLGRVEDVPVEALGTGDGGGRSARADGAAVGPPSPLVQEAAGGGAGDALHRGHREDGQIADRLDPVPEQRALQYGPDPGQCPYPAAPQEALLFGRVVGQHPDGAGRGGAGGEGGEETVRADPARADQSVPGCEPGLEPVRELCGRLPEVPRGTGQVQQRAVRRERLDDGGDVAEHREQFAVGLEAGAVEAQVNDRRPGGGAGTGAGAGAGAGHPALP